MNIDTFYSRPWSELHIDENTLAKYRNTNFIETFPEYKDWYLSLKENK